MKNMLADNEKALWILKTAGPQTLSAMARALNVTTEGARFHLLRLAQEGLVQSATHIKGRGRPQQIWSLTTAGHARFPDTHAELTVKLISTIRETLGEEALNAVINANKNSGILKYRQDLQDCKDLESRVNRLAEAREREGYMAECIKEEKGYLLVENHCPICAAARECQRFCSSELHTFQTVLGDDVMVERTEHLMTGARRCAYRITEK